MPTVTLTPSSEGPDTAWTLGAGASKTAAVQTNDGDTSYITSSTVGDNETFNQTGFAGFNVTPGANALLVSNVNRNTVGGSPQVAARIVSSGTAQNGSGQVDTGSYATYTDGVSFVNDPHTGSAWTAQGVLAVQIGVNHAVGAQALRVTQIYATINGISGGAGFAWLLACFPWLCHTIGSALTMAELKKVSDLIYRARLVRFHPDEYWELTAAFRELRKKSLHLRAA